MSAQIKDRLIYDSKETQIGKSPLEAYFKQRPEGRPNLSAANSGCWRGYTASWEIRDNRLYLRGLEMKGMNSSFESLFPAAPPDGVPANWFSGTILCAQGEFEVECGVVLETRSTLLQADSALDIKNSSVEY